MTRKEISDKDDDFRDFGEEQDFIAESLDELDKNIEEKEEDIIIPDFEEETQSLDESDFSSDKENIEETFDNQEEKNPEENGLENHSSQKDKEDDELQKKYEENSKKLDTWEELNKKNDIVKKYIVYIDKENIEAIDNLTVEKRNIFINSAIKLKFENDDTEKIKKKKKRLISHVIIMICVIVIFMPIAFYLAHLSIVMTFKNYKYSQDNFEKLYKESFSKSPMYIRAQKYSENSKKKK